MERFKVERSATDIRMAKDILGTMRKCAVIDMRNLICNFNLSFEGQDNDNFSYCKCTQGLLIFTFGNEMRFNSL